jgi:CRISPR-associated protein Csb2
MSNARPDVATAISGDERERLMIVPVPTLHFRDNQIRRVIVTGENEKLVRAAESAVAGLRLVDTQGGNRGYLLPTEYDSVFAQFLRPSKCWVAATPVLLSGFDDHDSRKRRKLLAKMFRHAGLPVPVSITEVKDKVRDFIVGTKHRHDKLHRMFCAVEFDTEVNGVISVGTGRYAGLGIFANLPRSNAV